MQLDIKDPNGAQRRIPIIENQYVIGRDPQLTISLQDKKISRRHARLYRNEGQIWMEDLRSSNGVKVEGKRILQPVPIEPGMRIEIGGFILTLVASRDGAEKPTRFVMYGRAGPMEGHTVALKRGQMTIGRGSDNALLLDDPSISRHHAVLVVQEQVTVEDLQSSNGTFINNERIAAGTLHGGEELRFGNVSFDFLAHGAAADAGFTGRSSAVLRPPIKRPFANGRPRTPLFIALGAACILLVILAVMFRHSPRTPTVRALGRLEQSYQKNLAASLAHAQQHAKAQDWDAAALACGQVLEADPINVAARLGLAAAELGRQHQALLAQATSALDGHQAARALNILSAIGAKSFYRENADSLEAKARSELSHDLLETANKVCKRGDWHACQEQGGLLLSYVPQSTLGLALIELAENGLRTRRQHYVPWNPSSSHRLWSVYNINAVRDAVLWYGLGEPAVAARTLPYLRRRGEAGVANAAITAFRKARAAADRAAAAGDMANALKGWEQALAIDSSLMAGSPSVFGSEVRSRLVGELLQLGRDAFGRGEFIEAYAQWHHGLVVDPRDPALNAALTELEMRAANMLKDTLSQGAELDAVACTNLRTITNMTRPDGVVNRTAREKLRQCPKNTTRPL